MRIALQVEQTLTNLDGLTPEIISALRTSMDVQLAEWKLELARRIPGAPLDAFAHPEMAPYIRVPRTKQPTAFIRQEFDDHAEDPTFAFDDSASGATIIEALDGLLQSPVAKLFLAEGQTFALHGIDHLLDPDGRHHVAARFRVTIPTGRTRQEADRHAPQAVR